jgi:hypothetical protein
LDNSTGNHSKLDWFTKLDHFIFEGLCVKNISYKYKMGKTKWLPKIGFFLDFLTLKNWTVQKRLLTSLNFFI